MLTLGCGPCGHSALAAAGALAACAFHCSGNQGIWFPGLLVTDLVYLTQASVVWLENTGAVDMFSSTPHVVTNQLVVRNRPELLTLLDVNGDGCVRCTVAAL